MFIDGSKLGGYTTNYKLEFRNVAQTLKVGSWFRLRFPKGYKFNNAQCSITGIKEPISCVPEEDGSMVLTFGKLTAEIPKSPTTM